MNRRSQLIVFCCAGAFAGLTFFALALTTNPPVQANLAASYVSVSITESGFDPAVVTVGAGESVVWTNDTQEVARLVSGEPYRTYLPLVLCNASGTRAATASPLMTTAADASGPLDDWGSRDIAPGESYVHTFITVGDYPYFLATHPDRTGLVVVPQLALEKECDPHTDEYNRVTCTIHIENTSFDDANVHVVDMVPSAVYVDPASVVGASQTGPNALEFYGFLAGGIPPEINLSVGLSPHGYISLASLGVPKITMGDEEIVNLSTDPFLYAGVTYTSIGMVSNGYVVVGGGDAGDIKRSPQEFPDPAPPSNVIAPFWTDLNGDAGGNFYFAQLTHKEERWIVLEWEDVPEHSSSDAYTFQIWIEALSGNEDISMVYERIDGDGAPSGVSVGAENDSGTYGDHRALLPWVEEEFEILFTPRAPGDSHTIYFEAYGVEVGPFTNCAGMTADTFVGMAIGCADSEVLPY